MSVDEFRVLTAVEMGMKNHEYVPTPLVESISGLKRGGAFKLIKDLCKHKLVAHRSAPCDSYRLTSKGYDFLALKALAKRGTLSALGIQIGVGKESDIFTVHTADGVEVCLKLHRLGRTCFRSVKNNRDYTRPGQHASWIYLSRLSALKEYAFMKALHAHGFPVPEPLDVNRHCVVMRLASGYQLNSIQSLRHPAAVFGRLMELIVKLAEHGLIHCDFNEFNLLVDEEERVTLIDFPQMVSTSHINADYYFDRDVACVATFFKRRFGFEPTELPSLERDTQRGALDLDVELAASGWSKDFERDYGRLAEMAAEEEARAGESVAEGDGEEGDGSDDEEGDGSDGEAGESDESDEEAVPDPVRARTLTQRAADDDDDEAGAAEPEDDDAAAAASAMQAVLLAAATEREEELRRNAAALESAGEAGGVTNP